MEELLGLCDQVASFPPVFKSKQLGQPWEEISQRMKHTLEMPVRTGSLEQRQGMYMRKKLYSEAGSPQGKPSLYKKVTIRDNTDGRSCENSRVRLKIIRAITEDQNVDSYKKSLTKRSSSEFNPSQPKKQIKLKELKLNSPSPYRKSTYSQIEEPLQISCKDNGLLLLKLRKNLQNNGQEINEYPLKVIKEQKQQTDTNQMYKNRSEVLSSPKNLIVPAKINILIRKQFENEVKVADKASPSYFLRKSIHIQEYSHLRDSRNDKLPVISLEHLREKQRQRGEIHASHSHKKWIFVHHNLAKSHYSNDDRRKSREKEMQEKLRRELVELNKKGKLFGNSRHSKLKLFK